MGVSSQVSEVVSIPLPRGPIAAPVVPIVVTCIARHPAAACHPAGPPAIIKLKARCTRTLQRIRIHAELECYGA